MANSWPWQPGREAAGVGLDHVAVRVEQDVRVGVGHEDVAVGEDLELEACTGSPVDASRTGRPALKLGCWVLVHML